MSTLLLRFAAPLQSWGLSSRFNRRTTEREPTKSGVIGLVAAALGRRRTDSIEDLQSLRFGVRVDQPGRLLVDYHTAHTADGMQSFISNRHYLADAVFLIGIEADDDILAQIDDAVHNPAFPLYLGRRSCPPEGKLSLGIRQEVTLEEALKNEEWQASLWYQRKAKESVTVEIVIDAMGVEPSAYQVRDLPLDFAQTYRRYTFRPVKRQHDGRQFDNPHTKARRSDTFNSFIGAPTKHDPFVLNSDSDKVTGEV